MKRIVQCPKCEAKLAVFDLGKPINQKCPKCGESFAIESQEKKGEAAADVKVAAAAPEAAKPAEATPAPEAKADKPAPAAPAKPEKADATASAPAAKPEEKKAADAPAPAAKPEEKAPAKAEAASAPAAAATDKKEIALKKPVAPAPAKTPGKPAAAPAEAEPVLHHCGFSFMNLVTIIGLLAIIIVMQVLAKVQSDKQYKKVIEHLQFIESKVGK